MSIGSLLLPLYLVMVLAYAWLAWRPAMQEQAQEPGWIGKLSGWISMGSWQAPRWMLVAAGLGALAFAFGIMLYTGAEVAILKSRPLWHTNWRSEERRVGKSVDLGGRGCSTIQTWRT